MARGPYVQSREINALRHLVAFAEEERVGLETIVRAGRAYVLPSALDAIRAVTPPETKALKQDLRAYFHAMARSERRQGVKPEYTFSVTLTAAAGSERLVLFVNGSPRDVLLYQATTLLQAIGTDRLWQCPAPDCQRAFIKVGRREFCSPKCQRRVFLANYDPFRAQSRRKESSRAKKTRTR